MKASEIAKINKANHKFIKNFNRFLGNEWKLEYRNKKGYVGSGLYLRNVQVSVNHLGDILNIGMASIEGKREITNDIFQEYLDKTAITSYLRGTASALNTAFKKYVAIQDLHTNLQANLSQNKTEQTKAVKV